MSALPWSKYQGFRETIQDNFLLFILKIKGKRKVRFSKSSSQTNSEQLDAAVCHTRCQIIQTAENLCSVESRLIGTEQSPPVSLTGFAFYVPSQLSGQGGGEEKTKYFWALKWKIYGEREVRTQESRLRTTAQSTAHTSLSSCGNMSNGNNKKTEELVFAFTTVECHVSVTLYRIRAHAPKHRAVEVHTQPLLLFRSPFLTRSGTEMFLPSQLQKALLTFDPVVPPFQVRSRPGRYNEPHQLPDGISCKLRARTSPPDFPEVAPYSIQKNNKTWEFQYFRTGESCLSPPDGNRACCMSSIKCLGCFFYFCTL